MGFAAGSEQYKTKYYPSEFRGLKQFISMGHVSKKWKKMSNVELNRWISENDVYLNELVDTKEKAI